VRTRRRSQHQAWARAGRVEVGATSDGNGARQAAARALGPASAGVMRMKESGWAGAGHWATRWAARGPAGKAAG
jgi:hypothetical protein